MIGILDVGIGNQGSIREAIYSLGYDPMSVVAPSQLEALTHLILPGVGSFSHAIYQLKSKNMINPIKIFAQSGRPLLGICLGMQLLASVGDEEGPSKGLDLISGRVSRLPQSSRFRVPHVGWNEVNFTKSHPVFEGIKDGRDFYFVHSYQFLPACMDVMLSNTRHGNLLISAVGISNIIGLQFHPEKSQKNGLKMLDNFCGWDGKC